MVSKFPAFSGGLCKVDCTVTDVISTNIKIFSVIVDFAIDYVDFNVI